MVDIRKAGAGVGAAAVGAAGAALRTARERTGGGKQEDATRWRAVTVLADEDALSPLPAPLAAWGDAIEVTTRPAPGDKGIELAARLRDPQRTWAPEDLDGGTPVQKLRSALRRSKQLLETGEILHSDRSFGTTEQTPLNAPLRAATDASGGEGRL
jgi:hypothetical protein